jgi:hypothetical protein
MRNLRWALFLLLVGIGMIVGLWIPDPGDALPGRRAYAESKDIQVSLNGKEVAFDVKPEYRNQRTYVPFRKLLEALGATVTWNQETQTATAVKDGLSLTISLGSQEILMKGHSLTMDVPVILTEDRTLVPLRYVAQALGARVDWAYGEQADRIKITQTYEEMIDRLVNGKNAPGDMQVTYEQATILFEWLYKGQEKGELPGFTGMMPIPLPNGGGYYSINGHDDEYLRYWGKVSSEFGDVYFKVSREIFSGKYRISEMKMYQKKEDQIVSRFIEIADQNISKNLEKGWFVEGYYPD